MQSDSKRHRVADVDEKQTLLAPLPKGVETALQIAEFEGDLFKSEGKSKTYLYCRA